MRKLESSDYRKITFTLNLSNEHDAAIWTWLDSLAESGEMSSTIRQALHDALHRLQPAQSQHQYSTLPAPTRHNADTVPAQSNQNDQSSPFGEGFDTPIARALARKR
jgi:hypothetical protein